MTLELIVEESSFVGYQMKMDAGMIQSMMQPMPASMMVNSGISTASSGSSTQPLVMELNAKTDHSLGEPCASGAAAIMAAASGELSANDVAHPLGPLAHRGQRIAHGGLDHGGLDHGGLDHGGRLPLHQRLAVVPTHLNAGAPLMAGESLRPLEPPSMAASRAFYEDHVRQLQMRQMNMRQMSDYYGGGGGGGGLPPLAVHQSMPVHVHPQLAMGRMQTAMPLQFLGDPMHHQPMSVVNLQRNDGEDKVVREMSYEEI